MSLVEILIATGMAMIAMTAISSVIVTQSKETKALEEKLSALDLEKNLISALNNGAVGEYILTSPTELTFDSSNIITEDNPVILTPSLPIYASYKKGPPEVVGPVLARVGDFPNPNLKSLEISEITLVITEGPNPLPAPGTDAIYKGHWQIKFNESRLIRALKPISVLTTLVVDRTTPGTSKITGCMSAGGSGVQIYRAQGNLGVHKFCALNVVQNGWETSIGNNQIGVYRNDDGTWTLSGACDGPPYSAIPRCGAVCID